MNQKLNLNRSLFLILFVGGILISTSFVSSISPNETYVDAIVMFHDDVEINLNELGIDSVLDMYFELNGFHAIIPKSLYDYLETAWFIEAIQEDRTVSIFQDTLDWGVDDVEGDQVWGGSEDAKDVLAGNPAGQNVKVCVIDTGIDYTHPDLDDNYKGGYDYANNDADPKDDNGHGTHCAGIIGAEDNGEGVIGVAPLVDLYAVKALDAQGSGTLSAVASGIDWAISNDMDVISMSLGASSGDPALESAINDAWNAGLVVVAASGNDGQEGISYPAKYSNAIAVGAIDSNHNLASFSNYGPEQEVVAPGVNVYSTMPTYYVTLNQWWYGGMSQNYDDMSGTSMACPEVAGVVALILSKKPTLTNDEVRTLLQTSADDLGATGFDNQFGYGLVNAKTAIDSISGGGDITPPGQVTGLIATTVSETQINLNWDANPEADMDHYNVYRNGIKITEVSSNSYSDMGLSPGTTYTYEISAIDTSNNEGIKSESVSATTDGTPSNTMHVESIEMWDEPIMFWIFILGYDIFTQVTIHDGNGNVLENVEVSMDLQLPDGSIVSETLTTAGDGTVTFEYNYGNSGTYTATITNLVLTGYTYESSQNTETSETHTT